MGDWKEEAVEWRQFMTHNVVDSAIKLPAALVSPLNFTTTCKQVVRE